jgi:hypothetical protein
MRTNGWSLVWAVLSALFPALAAAQTNDLVCDHAAGIMAGCLSAYCLDVSHVGHPGCALLERGLQVPDRPAGACTGEIEQMAQDVLAGGCGPLFASWDAMAPADSCRQALRHGDGLSNYLLYGSRWSSNMRRRGHGSFGISPTEPRGMHRRSGCRGPIHVGSGMSSPRRSVGCHRRYPTAALPIAASRAAGTSGLRCGRVLTASGTPARLRRLGRLGIYVNIPVILEGYRGVAGESRRRNQARLL